MKKLVMGCGCAVVLLGLAAAVAGYYFVVRPARAFVASLTELAEVADLETALTNTRAFAAPADAALTETQVQRFVAVQAAVKARMGARFTEMQAKYEALDAQRRDGQRSVGLADAVGAYRDLFGLIADARRAQIDALNAQQFSRGEYSWVRLRVYEAAGLAVTGVDLTEILEDAKQGSFQLPSQETSLDRPDRGVPAANKALVAPHVDVLQEWLPYAMFGL